MTRMHGPTVGRRRLRSALRRARETAGFTQEQVAEAMDWSLSKVIRIEAGTVSISTNDIKALLAHYRLNNRDRVDELVELARAARRRAWWSQYKEATTPTYLSYVGLEAEAAALCFFQLVGLPGLLQTADYAKAITRVVEGTQIEATAVDTIVEIRLRRQQEVLQREDPPEIEVILDEAVLRRHTGGPAVMRAQLLHLVELGDTPNITIRVMPFTAGEYTALGQFIILQFADPGDTDVVYIEGAMTQEIIDHPRAVLPYQRTFQQLQQRSLSPASSSVLLEKIAGELG